MSHKGGQFDAAQPSGLVICRELMSTGVKCHVALRARPEFVIDLEKSLPAGIVEGLTLAPGYDCEKLQDNLHFLVSEGIEQQRTMCTECTILGSLCVTYPEFAWLHQFG
jgi:hypothetical protein